MKQGCEVYGLWSCNMNGKQPQALNTRMLLRITLPKDVFLVFLSIESKSVGTSKQEKYK